MFSSGLVLQPNVPPPNATKNLGLYNLVDDVCLSQQFVTNFSISPAPPLAWVQSFDSGIYKNITWGTERLWEKKKSCCLAIKG